VLATGEALLLGRGDDFSIYYQRGGRVMKYSIDSQDSHQSPLD
jgi:hypothetical protein